MHCIIYTHNLYIIYYRYITSIYILFRYSYCFFVCFFHFSTAFRVDLVTDLFIYDNNIIHKI